MLFLRQLQLLPGVDHVRLQTVEFHDLGIAAAVSELLPGDFPQRVSVDDGVDPLRRVNRFAVRVEHRVAGILIGAGFRVGEFFERSLLRLRVRPGLPDAVKRLHGLVVVIDGRREPAVLLGTLQIPLQLLSDKKRTAIPSRKRHGCDEESRRGLRSAEACAGRSCQ